MALLQYQPDAAGKLYAAYRPIVMRAYLDYQVFMVMPAYPPVVFCDIYFNGVYYKTLSSSVYTTVGISYATGWNFLPFVTLQRPLWTFDIEDAAQEYLRSLPPALMAPGVVQDTQAIASFQVAFRTSSIDANGFIQPQAPPPVQGNFSVAPVSGAGLFSSTYLVANASLQHEDVQDLAQHLAAYQIYGVAPYNLLPLTHRVSGAYYNCPTQYDHFPLLIPNGGFGNFNNTVTASMFVSGKRKNGTTFNIAATNFSATLNVGSIYYVPTGIPQLATYTYGGGVFDWSTVASYLVSLYVGSVLATIWESPVMLATGCCCPDGARIHFLNALGGFDAVNFCERQETQITKSSNWQKSLPIIGLQKRDFGNARFNVRSNDKNIVRTNAYPEEAYAWLKEMHRSPRAYIEWKGSQGQANDLIPVKILDSEILTQKTEDRFEYLLEISYEPANEKIVQRG